MPYARCTTTASEARGKARIQGQGRGAQASKIRSTSRLDAATRTGSADGRGDVALIQDARMLLMPRCLSSQPGRVCAGANGLAATHATSANKPPMQTTAITIRPLIMVNVSSSILNIRHLIET